MIRTLAVLGILCVYLATGSAGEQTASVACPPELEPVREVIATAMTRGDRTPGVAVMVTKKGKTIWAEGFGIADLETKAPVTLDTIFLLASVSKPITATGLMMLVDEDKVRLDSPANEYLPGPKLRAFAGTPEEITVARLLSHTAGLPIHYNFYYAGSTRPTMDEAIARFGAACYAPGTRYVYSNFGFGVLEYMTEVVSGEPWAEFMERRVYDPLGMTGTSDHVRVERISDRAQPYTVSAGGRFTPVAAYDFDHRGASAIWSSAHDLTRFLRMHVNGGKLEGTRVLSKASAGRMLEPPLKNSPYGLGWFVEEHSGRRMFGHSGGMPGVSTTIAAWPDQDVTLVVLTNCDSNAGLPNSVQQRVERALIVPDNKSTPPQSNPKDAGKPDYAGQWKGRIAHFDGDIDVLLTVEKDGAAKVALGNGNAIPMRGVSLDLVFTGNIDGKLRVQDGYHGTPILTFRLEQQDADRMTGTVFAAASGYFGVSFWIEVTRAK